MKASRKNPGRIDSDAKFSALRSKVGITRLLHHLRAISSDELKTLQGLPLHGNRSNCRRTRDVLHCSDVLLVKTRDTETRKSSLASCNGFLPSSYHFIASRVCSADPPEDPPPDPPPDPPEDPPEQNVEFGNYRFPPIVDVSWCVKLTNIV